MDFLQLFPRHNRQSQMLFCNYRQLGMLCWCSDENNQLLLVSTLPGHSQSSISELEHSNGQDVLFKRISTIHLSPELPRNAKFSQLLVNRTGNLLALVGQQMVFVVELDADLWDKRLHACRRLDFESSVEHIRSEYFARCDLLHFSLFMRKYPPSVVKAIWFDPHEQGRRYFDAESIRTSGALLALLFSDCVLRLYDVGLIIDRPYATLDFNTLLTDSTPTESGDEFGDNSRAGSRPNSKYGFLTQIVSFDFGPVYIFGTPKAYSPIGSLLAMDMNGEIYIAFFHFPSSDNFMLPSSLPAPMGPLPCQYPATNPISTINSGRFICSSLDIHFIKHSNSYSLPLFAIVTEDGVLAHFALFNRSYGWEAKTGHSEYDFINIIYNDFAFEILVLECLQIADASFLDSALKKKASLRKPGANIIQFRSDLLEKYFPSSSATYFSVFAYNLYCIDLAPLLAHFIENCGGTNKNSQNINQQVNTLPQSSVRQILSFASEKAKISSIASLLLPTSPTECTNLGSQLHLLAILLKQTKAQQNEQRFRFKAFFINKSCFYSPLASEPPCLSPAAKQKQLGTLECSPQLSLEIRRQLEANREEGMLLACKIPSIEFNNADDNDAERRETISHRIAHISIVQDTLKDVFINKAFPAQQRAVSYLLERAAILLSNSLECVRFNENAQQRLKLLFRQTNELKSKVLKSQHQFRAMEQRIDKLAECLRPLMCATSTEEIKAIEKLLRMRQLLSESRREIKHLNKRLVEFQHLMFQSSVSKCNPEASREFVPAQLFSLFKNERHCCMLQEQLGVLERRIADV